jgi:predicted Zn-dependent peptidase
MYDYNGPMLWIVQVFHDSDKPADSLLSAFDAALEPLRSRPLSQADLDRALVKLRSSFYSELEARAGFGRANLLASFALFDDDPGRINKVVGQFDAVTAAQLQEVAKKYLVAANRTAIDRVPEVAK